MRFFKLAPFRCPECGHELAVDGVRHVEGEDEVWETNEVFDMTTLGDPDDFTFEHKADIRAMGSYRRYVEIVRLRNELRAYETRGKLQRFLDGLFGRYS